MSRTAFRPALGVRLLMLSAAYAPLLLLLAVLNTFRIEWLRWVFAALCVAGVAMTALFLGVLVRRRNAVPEAVFAAKPREGEALRFFASYVVPFFITATSPPAVRWALLIYLLLIALLYLQADLYFSNPLLALAGYRVFELTRENREFLLVISRAWHLAPGEVVRLVPLGGYVHVHLRSRREEP